jgi:hypothetical protein
VPALPKTRFSQFYTYLLDFFHKYVSFSRLCEN